MATSSSITSLYLLSPSFHTFNKNTQKSNLSDIKKSSYYQPPISIFTLSNQTTIKLTQNPYQRLNIFTKNHKNFKVLALEDTTNSVSSEDTTQQIVSVTSDNSEVTSTVITVLLSIAFVALTILTIGVIFISVTDFLQKREKEKFEKEEEEAKKKKGGKKVRARSRAGPRGFGQKIDVDEDDD